MDDNRTSVEQSERVVIFDIETQKNHEDVGGWQNRKDMLLSFAVVYDSSTQETSIYSEREVHRLIEHLKSADIIVGYGIHLFDYTVLSNYTDYDFTAGRLSIDILEEIQSEYGKRVKLSTVASATLNIKQQESDGLQAVQWFKDGENDKIMEYCMEDVSMLKDIFRFAVNNGYLNTLDEHGNIERFAIDLV